MLDIINYFLTFFVLIVPPIYLLFIFYRFRTELLNSKLILFFITIYTVLLFHKLLFFNQTLAAQDFNNLQIPFFESFRSSLQKYFLVPIWNSNFGGGFDIFSNPLAFYFSSFSFIFYFIPDVYFAANIYVFLQVLVLGIFSYLMLRELSFDKYSSFIGAMLLTFNGFVTMRLSPGVGTEYLFAFKWLPLIILFTHSLFINKRKADWIFLSLSLAMAFEGNTNIAISVWLFWGVLVLFLLNKNVIKNVTELIKIVLFSFSIFAIKIIPGIDLMMGAQGRISEVVSGWRAVRVSPERIFSYFLPIKDSYLAGPFTPGLIGFTFFILGILVLLINVQSKRKIPQIQIFGILSLITGIILTSDNPIAGFVFSLPLLNRLTVNPSFYIFLLIPLGIFSAFFVNFCYQRFSKFSKLLNYVFTFFSFLIILEILTGPSTFGSRSYSFNFSKMEIAEKNSYPLYEFLVENTAGNFVFIDTEDTFVLPNIIQINSLNNLNKSDYFYGSSYFDEIPEERRLENYKIHTNNIISSKEIPDPELSYVGQVDMRDYYKKYDSYSTKIVMGKYFDYINKIGWDEILRVYKVSDEVSKKALINYSDHPFKFSFLVDDKNLDKDKLLTSISYSKHWNIYNSSGQKLTYEKESNGLTIVNGVLPFETIYFNYFNTYIYLGLVISLFAFAYFLFYSLKHTKISYDK